MAGTVTWSLLRELAGFRADKGCAISLLPQPRSVRCPDRRGRPDADELDAEHAGEGRPDRPDARAALGDQGGLRADRRVVRQRLRARGLAGPRGLRRRARQRLADTVAPGAGSGPREGQQRLLSRAARAARRPGRRDDRRGGRARAGPALPSAGRTARGDRRALRRAAGAARPGRLVAEPVPAAHREARAGAPEGRRAGARPQQAAAAGAEDRAGLL